MVEETVFAAPISQLRIWSLLSDLPTYRQWHPHYRFMRRCQKGCHAQMSRLFFNWRRIRMWVKIESEEKPRVFGWTSKLSSLCRINERYVIVPTQGGADIQHIVEFKGVLGEIAGRLSRREIREEMAQQDAALLKALKKQTLRPPRGKGQLKLVPASTRRRTND
ncbi:MAG: hypothetical protein B7X90_11775 [Novosphingobium sp. 17-62-19]|uniref:SRPBCC family protein n=1 Tax=Novosphingobium sp. 17-62-19 TaxID=1970406 RepID=UPI000BD7540C|nr:hypothetical protein [Novosphingobium sp. 17-62-19]OYX95674.1 MAG: hypothetical protein B7Y74_03595 [Novosphingobium sp. 35-62-5]OZA18578.1 MAG: hypothetical protein B7X90_11775 [Novosphingobium sp. 17-62-19]OZA72622.1 MAG: hypothetical protein B7X78_00700 [Sphingomonadales bacterium 39-62-4]HQS96792.1 hypothetical protein [Novosphingobium sp.]